jgi:hypothetical protein
MYATQMNELLRVSVDLSVDSPEGTPIAPSTSRSILEYFLLYN